MLKPLKIRNFRLLWLGESASLLGDQFFLIALPWLVLKLSSDAFAVGAVLAVAGIPRPRPFRGCNIESMRELDA